LFFFPSLQLRAFEPLMSPSIIRAVIDSFGNACCGMPYAYCSVAFGHDG